MSSAPASAIAAHVEAAKRLLRELDEHAQSAIDSLRRQATEDFASVVAERDALLTELDRVVGELAASRSSGAGGRQSAAAFDEIGQAALAALETHKMLVEQTRVERDRIAAALDRADKPDAVATRYSLLSGPRGGSLSIAG